MNGWVGAVFALAAGGDVGVAACVEDDCETHGGKIDALLWMWEVGWLGLAVVDVSVVW